MWEPNKYKSLQQTVNIFLGIGSCLRETKDRTLLGEDSWCSDEIWVALATLAFLCIRDLKIILEKIEIFEYGLWDS